MTQIKTLKEFYEAAKEVVAQNNVQIDVNVCARCAPFYTPGKGFEYMVQTRSIIGYGPTPEAAIESWINSLNTPECGRDITITEEAEV